MKEPIITPEKVTIALTKWRKERNLTESDITLRWDSLNGCYYFWHDNVFHGVELDGHIHT